MGDTTERSERRPRILMAEDERAVRELSRRVLEREGYEVVAVEDGAAAVEATNDGDGFDLLFFDIVMPRMTGREAANLIRSARPELPVLFTSGCAGKELDGATLGPGERFVAKPYSPAELRETIRALLDASRRT